MKKRTPWSENEDKQLHKMFRKFPNFEIAQKLGRSESSVKKRIESIITIESRKAYHWTKMDDEMMLSHYGNIPLEELSQLLRRTPRAIQCRLLKLEGAQSATIVSGDYTSTDIATFTGVDCSTVGNWARCGKINMIIFGRGYYMRHDNFWNWMKDNLHRINPKGIKDEDLIGSPKWYQNAVAQKKKETNESRKNEFYTSTEDALIWRLYTCGVKIKDITANTKRTQNSVSHRLRKLKKEKWAGINGKS